MVVRKNGTRLSSVNGYVLWRVVVVEDEGCDITKGLVSEEGQSGNRERRWSRGLWWRANRV